MRTLTKLEGVLMLKVSIIIPTKNNGDILEKCLASIKQTLGKFDQQPFRKSLTNKLFFLEKLNQKCKLR